MVRHALSVGLATVAVALANARAEESSSKPIPAVSVNKSACECASSSGSYWDFLKFQKLQALIGQAFSKTPTKPAITVTTLGDETVETVDRAEDGQPVNLRIQSVRYLASLERDLYPGVLDTLIASLDDSDEAVRYEALLALQKQLGFDDPSDTSKSVSTEGAAKGDRDGLKLVVRRLNDHLLEIDESGALREKSPRVRTLARSIIGACLQKPKGHRPDANGDVPQTIPVSDEPRTLPPIEPKSLEKNSKLESTSLKPIGSSEKTISEPGPVITPAQESKYRLPRLGGLFRSRPAKSTGGSEKGSTPQ